MGLSPFSLEGDTMARIGLSVILALGLAYTAEAAVWYVDKDNVSGVEDGLTWLTAYTTIHAAVNAASAYDDVWVAEGTYDKTRDNETGSLIMKEDVDIYGGFPGPGSTWDDRNWKNHTTTIDGSTSRNGDAAYHVLIGADRATLDGFVVTGGNTNSRDGSYGGGGALLNIRVSPTISNCRFENNVAHWTGGAINNHSSSPVITGCTFLGNVDGGGGGRHIYCNGSSPVITDCLFEGGMEEGRSGLRAISGSATISGCTFREFAGGGRAVYAANGSHTILDCTFTDNIDGGGIHISSSDGESVVERCVFQGNSAEEGGAIYTDARTTINDCIFRDNSADRGGAVYVALWPSLVGSAYLKNCVFVGNASESGGIIQTDDVACGMMTCTHARVSMRSCSLAGNTPAEGFGVLHFEHAYSILRNTILWNVGATEMVWSSNTTNEYVPSTYHCDIRGGFEGASNIDAVNNIDADPMFVSPEGGNLRLKAGSPCIDTGTAAGAPKSDITGIITRPIGPGIDMGAYEYIDTDIDGNTTVNAIDVQLVINAALGIPIPPFDTDVDDSGETNATDVQLVINATLGL